MTAKLLVSSGNPDQERCGEQSSPPAPNFPDAWGMGIGRPSVISVLVTVNVGTSGKNQRAGAGVQPFVEFLWWRWEEITRQSGGLAGS